MDENYILEIKNLTKDFGGVKALNDFEMEVKQGEIHDIIGPNGAGKSTLFNTISGFIKEDKGEIFFKDREISNLAPEKRVDFGLGRTFQKSNIVSDMSVIDNIMAGMYLDESNPIKSFFTEHFSIFSKEKEMKKRAIKALDFVGLAGYEKRWSDELVWVERQLVQLARAVVISPDLLLLDEPAAGMGEKEKEKIKDVIRDIRAKGITVIVISHDLEVVMDLSDYISVINFGQLLFSGTPEEVKQNEKVMEAYTGE